MNNNLFLYLKDHQVRKITRENWSRRLIQAFESMNAKARLDHQGKELISINFISSKPKVSLFQSHACNRPPGPPGKNLFFPKI